ncbi:hypothetical protein ACFV9W_31460 [Streptomyces sp. NPDC059897]|uniref:hypothetical protein n=1 Tax=Streptomyces sp. NPDC059897 TaxID=3346994 RepID=UPI003666931C
MAEDVPAQPIAGSTPPLVASAAVSGPVVHYSFPVEVEVVCDMDDAAIARITARVLAELDRELARRQ